MPRTPAIGEFIDGRYRATDVCSTDGGMGTILHVDDTKKKSKRRLVLKYCKAVDDKTIGRFRRETRLLGDFEGNSRIVQLYDLNLEYDPPYYVMRFYEDGDLQSGSVDLTDEAEQERIFLEMVDCIAELHAADIYHRDIKPQNFLVDDGAVVVSDLGLSMERESLTRATSSAEAWGTMGFTPPEYMTGGFKNADAAGDIFMLGKSFYVLLSNRDPLYLVGDDIHPAIFSVIERCCAIAKTSRYQKLSELKQAIAAAYDVILKRVEGYNLARQMLGAIMDRLESESKYSTSDVTEFLDLFERLTTDEQDELCGTFQPRLFRVLGQPQFSDHHAKFVAIYDHMVRRHDYGFGFAERIADCIEALTANGEITPKVFATSLDSAINAAAAMNRFAAMDTCTAIITAIEDQDVAVAVRPVLLGYPDTFVSRIEPVRCQNDLIAQTIQKLREEEAKKAEQEKEK